MTVKASQFTFNQKYSSFDQLDGQHPWAKTLPEGCILYPVRELNKGKVVYFNYSLAKEMGLIDSTHTNKMTPDLEQKLLNTFSLQIINEYDELTKKRFPAHTIKKNKYMATRYLQLQHQNKKGKTSGDGRGIWNGVVTFNGKTWDVSSRGTGVTSLSPGAVAAQKPLRTGAGEFGYGCGLAEIDELLGAAVFAEVMHLQGIPTERVLCVVSLGNGHGIGVRASLNLLRPAHLFLYLKQNRRSELKRGTDYFIERQLKNKRWKLQKDKNMYDQSLEFISKSFAQFSAQLETDYIFAWLDWDGDNVLADAGIIDYGSIRQFGVCHDKYRYDDIERFSTTLTQQKAKAQLIVQVFAQMFDYIKTGEKKKINQFKNHSALKIFRSEFSKSRMDRFLYRFGFTNQQRIHLQKHKQLVNALFRIYSFLETSKTHQHYKKIADGINIFPLYNMRKLILRFNSLIKENAPLDPKDVLRFGLTQQGKKLGRKKVQQHFNYFIKLFNIYKKTIQFALESDKKSLEQEHTLFFNRSARLNSQSRITGNALIEVVDSFWKTANSTNNLESAQESIDFLIQQYLFMPEVQPADTYFNPSASPQNLSPDATKLHQIILNHSEDI